MFDFKCSISSTYGMRVSSIWQRKKKPSTTLFSFDYTDGKFPNITCSFVDSVSVFALEKDTISGCRVVILGL